ncbi:YdcH family protein [Amphiplicatus metriothermophilus]|uniref:DUF465 domain-containing protein n=1 Tax=Amphiplicatus metriothermophilus TaxID=1519374 RepID=A0A239PQP4_9PROT|nr:DUF465 domain-containing protein [Amphiplicatus metriothermophilus]MBB5518579.1 hypothetical protein [Amphiplicatus metriothermophilus]SNT72262.1 hypothetical protein SAMN06297382_1300 [Amphiplicatus metriothermophilus]
MALKAHLETLTQRHQELEAAIAAELKHPSHDDARVTELKRLKLRIKDQIESIRTQNGSNSS